MQHAGGSREAPKGSGPGPPLHQLLQAAAQGPDGPQEASTAEAPPGAIRRRLSNNLQSALRELWVSLLQSCVGVPGQTGPGAGG